MWIHGAFLFSHFPASRVGLDVVDPFNPLADQANCQNTSVRSASSPSWIELKHLVKPGLNICPFFVGQSEAAKDNAIDYPLNMLTLCCELGTIRATLEDAI